MFFCFLLLFLGLFLYCNGRGNDDGGGPGGGSIVKNLFFLFPLLGLFIFS